MLDMVQRRTNGPGHGLDAGPYGAVTLNTCHPERSEAKSKDLCGIGTEHKLQGQRSLDKLGMTQDAGPYGGTEG